MLLHSETTICTILILTFETPHWRRGEKSSVDCSGSREEMRRGGRMIQLVAKRGEKGEQILKFLVVLLMIFNAMNSRMC